MATRLTEKQEAAACDVAELVYGGQLTNAAGVARLRAEDGLNVSTGAIFIAIYKSLREGQEFRRTTSAAAMRLLMQNIERNHGSGARDKSLTALRAHINYFERHYDTTMTKMRAVLVEFER